MLTTMFTMKANSQTLELGHKSNTVSRSEIHVIYTRAFDLHWGVSQGGGFHRLRFHVMMFQPQIDYKEVLHLDFVWENRLIISQHISLIYKDQTLMMNQIKWTVTKNTNTKENQPFLFCIIQNIGLYGLLEPQTFSVKERELVILRNSFKDPTNTHFVHWALSLTARNNK